MPTYRINVGLTYPGAGGPGVNTWHARTDGLQTSDVQTLIDELETFYTTIRGIYPDGTVMQCPNEIVVDPYGEPEYMTVEGWSLTGAGGPNMLPPSNQVVVTWRTTSATRSGRGRSFIGPCASVALQADGTVNTQLLDILRSASSALVAASEGALNGAFGVYSRTDGLFRDFTASNVRDRFSVLRSRRD